MQRVAHPSVDDHSLHACLLAEEEQAYLPPDTLPISSESQSVKATEESYARLPFVTKARAPVGLDVHQLLGLAQLLHLLGGAFDLRCKIDVVLAGVAVEPALELPRGRVALEEVQAGLVQRFAKVRVHLVKVVGHEKREEGFSITS